MMKRLIQIGDFQKIEQDGFMYYSMVFADPCDPCHKEECEITLEPCGGGFCVGLYDMNRQTLKKECTKFDRRIYTNPTDKMTAALSIAQIFYDRLHEFH